LNPERLLTDCAYCHDVKARFVISDKPYRLTIASLRELLEDNWQQQESHYPSS
jgi:hypothetical protein